MSYEAQDLINRLIIHNPSQRLGANGSTEVKAHPFFKGVDWDNLALQKAAFVPNPSSVDDTSYFVSRFSQMSIGMPNDKASSHSDSDMHNSSSNSGVEVGNLIYLPCELFMVLLSSGILPVLSESMDLVCPTTAPAQNREQVAGLCKYL
ncbi:hypothetical protein OIU76_008565 [Salix suchowensis]|nr:hypothetical protein OIU76_008565 [Salix suchowensis]